MFKHLKNHALKDLNPRHQVLETYVLPTELRARYFNKDTTNNSSYLNLISQIKVNNKFLCYDMCIKDNDNFVTRLTNV